MKFLSFTVQSIFMLVALGIGGLFLLPYVPIDNPIELRIVQSGSMEPSIMTGALIAVVPDESYQVGDVIMFGSRYADVPTTHRIVDTYTEGGRSWFITKGDANEEADTEAVSIGMVKGKVLFDVPRLGFVLDFARHPVGFMFLIVLPAFLIILGEVEKIWREIKKRGDDSEDGQDNTSGGGRDRIPESKPVLLAGASSRMMDIATPVRYMELPTLDLSHIGPYVPKSYSISKTTEWGAYAATAVLALVVFASSFLGSTVSYFNDIERSLNNALATIALDFTALPDGEMYTFLDGEITDEDGAVVVVISPEAMSVDMQYDVSAAVVGTSTPLCGELTADAALPLSYNGALAALTGEDVLFDMPWSVAFDIASTSALTGGEVCDVAITFTAWYYDEAADQGYFDEEVVPLHFEYLTSAGLTSFSSFSLSAQSFTAPAQEEASTTPPTKEPAPQFTPTSSTSDDAASSSDKTASLSPDSEVEEEEKESDDEDEQEEKDIEKPTEPLVEKDTDQENDTDGEEEEDDEEQPEPEESIEEEQKTAE